MMHRRLAPQADERGATAVLVALLALVLLGIGAVAVDMGQVYAKRSSLQSAVDMAVLAAANELDGSNNCTADAVSAAKSYLEDNWIDSTNDPINVDLAGSEGDPTGFIKCTGWYVELWAPDASVDFGLAKAVSDAGGVEVPAFAAAGVFSPGTGVMPAYAVSGCDSGPQTLLDDSAGQSGPVTPPELPYDTPDTNTQAPTIDSIDPAVILLNEVTGLTIDGNKLASVTMINFQRPVGEGGANAQETYATRANGTVTVASIPPSVTSTEGIWWVSVSRDPNGTPLADRTWSNAVQLQVGDAILECSSDVADGNFGALKLYRDPDTNTNDRLALNMALGLDFTLTTYPGAGPGWTCFAGDGTAVVSTNNDLNDGTNCVPTDTGLPAEATEAGLITGVGSVPGSLTTSSTHSGCGSDQTIDFGGSTGSYTINNDYLTCFFTDGTTTIGSIGTGYSGGPVISEDIFDSPRFYWVPVFGTQASTGGSTHYQIVDFRPGFITDQDNGATRDVPNVEMDDTINGIGLTEVGNGFRLRSLKVVFFDVDALPDSVAATHPTTTYMGVGPKIISLVK